MNKEQRALVENRMARARETIDEARLLLSAGHTNACVNRLYYASFYAVLALLLTEGRSSSRHSGVRALFDREWVKSGRIPVALGRLYRRLFESRQQGDYADFVVFDLSTVSPWVEEASDFVEKIWTLIDRME